MPAAPRHPAPRPARALGRALLGLAALVLATGPAQAQPDPRWRAYGPGEIDGFDRIAEVCPMNDRVSGNAFCILVGCARGGPLIWRIAFTWAGLVPERLRATFSVDGQVFPAVGLELTRRDPFFYAAPVDPAGQAPLLAALRAGAQGLVFFDTDQVNPQTFTLRGSSAALAPVLRACPVAAPAPATPPAAPPVAPELVAPPAPPPIPAPVPPGPAPGTVPAEAATADPVAQVRAEIAAFCGVPAARLAVGAGFLERKDLSGDGIADFVFDYGAAECPAYGPMAWCGTGGCTHAVWMSQPGGGYREVFNDTVYGVAPGPRAPDGRPVLLVESHGAGCGLTGAQGPCLRRFAVASDGRLDRLE